VFTTACCLVVGLGSGLGLGLDLVSGWLVVMHTYLYYFRLSLAYCVSPCVTRIALIIMIVIFRTHFSKIFRVKRAF